MRSIGLLHYFQIDMSWHSGCSDLLSIRKILGLNLWRQTKHVEWNSSVCSSVVRVFHSRNYSTNFLPPSTFWNASCLLSKNVQIRIYRTIILPVVLYGYETWSLTLMEEHTLRVFYNRMLNTMFGPKRDEVIGGCKKLHEELHNLYSASSIIRMTKSKGWDW
jgi:hypothetical protein